MLISAKIAGSGSRFAFLSLNVLSTSFENQYSLFGNFTAMPLVVLNIWFGN